MQFRIKGKCDKIRFVPIHPLVSRLIEEHLEMGKLGGGIAFELEGPSSAPWLTPYRDPRKAPGPLLDLSQHRYEICEGNGRQRGSNRRLCAFDAGDSGDQRVRAWILLR